MSRSGEDAPTRGRPAGPEPSDGPAPPEAEPPGPGTPRPHTEPADPDDDPFTGYEAL